ncbi:TIGR04388 family protein [Leptospira hartskeerlii]|nr:TIGR04388 family protein [Leptospira hartskeerlii]
MNRLKTLFLACVLFGAIFPFSDGANSQSVSVPDLNVQSFSPYWQQQLQGSYSVANSMQDVTHWDSFILQSYSILQSEWQAQVQAQIQAAVAGINTQDSFQSVQDYKNYVYDSMESQAAAFLSTWQVAAEASIEAQRNTFIDTYYSGNAAQVANLKSQFDQEFSDLINGNNPTVSSGSNSDTSFLTNAQTSLLQLEQQWYAQFNSNLSNGLWNYEQALQSLTSNYQDLLTQINNTEAQYQANLAQIQSYQNNIKEQVKSTMDGYQQFLNGNDLFWNSVSTLYDTTANGYVVPTCSSGNCTDYTYDSTSHQFVSSCSSGDTCVQLRYDNVSHAYLNPSCPTNHDCSANSSHPTVSIHTSLNTDGQTFQNLINSIENAIINGKSTYAIFDQTTAEMLSYPQSCLSDSSNCVIGWYDSTQSKFIPSASSGQVPSAVGGGCPAGDVCYQAIVDATNSSALTGLYYANSCPAGDTSCVVCPSTSSSQDTCQIQSMDASLVYAATAMSNFLQNEQAIAQNQVTAYQTGLTPQTHTIDTSISLSGLLSQDHSGASGLAMEVIGLLTGQVTSEEFANWLMNTYSAGLVGSCSSGSPDSDPACLLGSLAGLSPGTTITSVSTVGTDLEAYNGDLSTCHDWAGCSPFPFTINTVTLFITADPWYVGEAYGQKFSENHTWGQADGNFYNYTEIQNWGVFGIYYGAAPVLSWEDRIKVTTSYTTVDNNAHADATTWQDLNLQLQSFSYNWAQNVLPAILNWTGQVSSFEAQYAAWQQTETSLLAQAQQDYIAQLQQLQSSETAWLAQMNSLQKEANSDFTTANNKLRDGQDQSNAGFLAQEILGNLKLHANSSGKEISESATLDSSGLFSSLISKIGEVDPNSGLPNFGLLASFSNSFQSAVSGATNLTLLSSTNNALLNSRANYMQQLADSLAHERTFTQNGQSELLRQHGDYSAKEVEGKTYLINQNGNFVHCDANGANCSACTGGVAAADCGTGGATELGNYITSICGQNLDADKCGSYTTLKYSNVHVDENGDLVADEKIYNGKASLCQNGNATNAGDYCFQQTLEHLTIKAPSAFGLGFGGSSLGNVFDSSKEAGDRISAAIGRSFASMNDFFVNNGYTSAIMADLRAADMHNNMNATMASNSAAQQAQNANFVADFVSMMVFGGATTQEFMAHEAHQFVQNAITTFLVKTFDMSPEVAAFLSGGLLDHMAYKEAQHTLNHNGLNFMKNNLGLGGDLVYKIAGGLFYKDDLQALSQWKDDRYQVYGLAVTEYGKSQNWDSQTIQLASQLAVDYLRQRDAKMELGMRGSMFSISRLEGMVNSLAASIEGPIMEGVGAFAEANARYLRNVHVISKREEKEFGENLRYAINDIKLKDDKDAIKLWKEDQAQTAVFAVGQYGKQHGWTQDEIGQMERFAYDYVKNKQADREFGETSSLFSLGRVEGQLKLVASDVGGIAAEGVGAFAKLAGEGLRDLHLITNADEKRLDNSLRQNIDATKMREYKDAQKVWHADKSELAKTEVSLYGHANGWSDAQIAQISDLVGNYVIRQQAKADLRKLQDTETILTLGIGTGLTYLDRQAFKGGLLKMTTQLGRGILTTVADIFRDTGLLSKEDTKYFYKQTKDWSDDVSGSAFEAKTHQGSIDKHWFKEQERELVFDALGKMLDPSGPPEQQEMFSQVLKAYFDHKEQKKQEKEAREQQAEMAVELAASVLITAGSGGAGSGVLMDLLIEAGEFLGYTEELTTAAEISTYLDKLVDVADMIKYGAAAVDIGAQTYFGYKDGGTNGAVAGFVNGVLSVATALKEWPVTGYVSWTPHQNGDILLGEDARAGGWGGGLTGTLGNVNGGVSFTPGSGIDLNINYNFDGKGSVKQGTFIGFDYSAGNGGYSVNGGYDFNPNGNNHIGLTGSASSTGSASIGAFYNYSNSNRSHNANGLGGTLNYSNDGTIRGSAQYRGADTWSLSYNTETHKFGKIEANENFQRDYNNSIAQEHAGEHRGTALEPIITGVSEHLVANGVMSREQVHEYLQSGKGEQLLQKYQEHKAEIVSQRDGNEKFKAEIQKTSDALAKIGLEGTPTEAVLGNKSAEGVFEKIWSGIKGEAKLVFGMSDTGQIRVNEKGQLEFDTCFVAGTLIRTKEGFTSIEKLKVGDYVLSHNEKTGQLSYNKVTETFIHDVPAIYKITYTNGTEVETTWNHPFYIKGEGWTKAKFLSPEQRSVTVSSIRNAAILQEMSSRSQMSISLAALNNKATTTPWNELYEGTAGIAKIERVIHPEKVYNIEVEGDHSYFVTRAGLLVHNYPKDDTMLTVGAREILDKFKTVNKEGGWLNSKGGDPELSHLRQEGNNLVERFDRTNAISEAERGSYVTAKGESELQVRVAVNQNKQIIERVQKELAQVAKNVPGLHEIIELVKNVDPSKGFTIAERKRIQDWAKTSLKDVPFHDRSKVQETSFGQFLLKQSGKESPQMSVAEPKKNWGNAWSEYFGHGKTRLDIEGHQEKIAAANKKIEAVDARIKIEKSMNREAIEQHFDKMLSYANDKFGTNKEYTALLKEAKAFKNANFDKNVPMYAGKDYQNRAAYEIAEGSQRFKENVKLYEKLKDNLPDELRKKYDDKISERQRLVKELDIEERKNTAELLAKDDKIYTDHQKKSEELHTKYDAKVVEIQRKNDELTLAKGDKDRTSSLTKELKTLENSRDNLKQEYVNSENGRKNRLTELARKIESTPIEKGRSASMALSEAIYSKEVVEYDKKIGKLLQEKSTTRGESAISLEKQISELSSARENEVSKQLEKSYKNMPAKEAELLKKLRTYDSELASALKGEILLNSIGNSLDKTNAFAGDYKNLNTDDPILVAKTKEEEKHVIKPSEPEINMKSLARIGEEGMPSAMDVQRAKERLHMPLVDANGKLNPSMSRENFNRAVDNVFNTPIELRELTPKQREHLNTLGAEVKSIVSDLQLLAIELREAKAGNDKEKITSLERKIDAKDSEFKVKQEEYLKLDPHVERLSKLSDNSILNQVANGGMSVQSALIIETLRVAGKEKFKLSPELQTQYDKINSERAERMKKIDEDPMIDSSKKIDLKGKIQKEKYPARIEEFFKIKEWVFSDKTSQQLGNDIASAICKVYNGYAHTVDSNLTQSKFGEFLIHKFRNGDVAFGGNSAPVLDQNGMKGYNMSINKREDISGNVIRNDMDTIALKKGANGKDTLTGVTNPLRFNFLERLLGYDQAGTTLEEIPDNTTVQIYGDTNEKFGPNHYWLSRKINGVMYDFNNNTSRTNGIPEILHWDIDDQKAKGIWGIFYYKPKK